jgi:signal transduction histidine kinase
MKGPASPEKDRAERVAVIVLAMVIVGFVIAAVLEQQATARIERLAGDVVDISAPSIERLTAIRSGAVDAQLALTEYLGQGAAGGGAARSTVETALVTLDEHVRRYLSLPLLEGEQPYWRDIQSALVRFEDAVRRTQASADDGERADAQEELLEHVEPARQELIGAAMKSIDFHAQKSLSIAAEVRQVRRRAVLLSTVLSAACVALGIAGLFVILLRMRRHRQLVRAYSDFHKARADELEWFAGRVAHDIRGPLSGAVLAAQLTDRRTGDSEVKKLTATTLRSLARADAITTALLDFARSGAQPDPGARTTPSEVLDDLLVGMTDEARQARVELKLEPVPAVRIACAPGVYLSLVGNLVRNALKYMADATTRRVVISVSTEGSMVRTEVADTGPGIDAQHLGSLFEPYFRVDRSGAANKAGLGLGLATVKRLAEGHLGDAGVRSQPGQGSTFWFRLPVAGVVSDALEQGDAGAAPALH